MTHECKLAVMQCRQAPGGQVNLIIGLQHLKG